MLTNRKFGGPTEPSPEMDPLARSVLPQDTLRITLISADVTWCYDDSNDDPIHGISLYETEQLTPYEVSRRYRTDVIPRIRERYSIGGEFSDGEVARAFARAHGANANIFERTIYATGHDIDTALEIHGLDIGEISLCGVGIYVDPDTLEVIPADYPESPWIY